MGNKKGENKRGNTKGKYKGGIQRVDARGKEKGDKKKEKDTVASNRKNTKLKDKEENRIGKEIGSSEMEQ